MEEMVNQKDLFGGVFKGKRVLVIGHTGFKGSWLSLWLLELGARVAGFSIDKPSVPCHFDAIDLKSRIQHFEGDVRNYDQLKEVFDEFKPQIVFHLAAQALVRESYEDPKTTFDTNLGGTVNVMECIRHTDSVKSSVIITSDKCYENVNWDWGYRENDLLGGEDPYSASKACAEIAFSSYFRCFFKNENKVQIATTRAGNVIGGGDWALDRIVPDCIKSWSDDQVVTIRKPHATRPWQHVLEPLSGYLWLGACLYNKQEGINGEPFNFGPKNEVVKSVYELVELLLGYWGRGDWKHEQLEREKKEANLLKLSVDKALRKLSWKPILSFDETVELTAKWYKDFYGGNENMIDYSCSQINYYIQRATEEKISWATLNNNPSKVSV